MQIFTIGISPLVELKKSLSLLLKANTKAMKRISEFSGGPLQWKQPHLTSAAFELKSNEELLATLKFSNAFGTLATGECADGAWTFKRIGFLNTHVSIRIAGTENDIAVYRNSTWSQGGTLELPDGRRYKANSNFWHSQFEFTGKNDEPLIRYTNIGGFKLHAQMELLKPAIELKELSWIVILGWYLTVMMNHDAGVVAAIA